MVIVFSRNPNTYEVHAWVVNTDDYEVAQKEVGGKLESLGLAYHEYRSMTTQGCDVIHIAGFELTGKE